MSHVEQELLTLPEHMSSPPVFNGDRVARVLVFLCDVLKLVVCPFVPFVLAIVLSFDSGYLFGIFKPFLK